MRIYLDMCSLQRPFDDKSQIRIIVEAEAILAIIAACESGQAELVASIAHTFEGDRNPNLVRKTYSKRVLAKAQVTIDLSPEVEREARTLNQAGIKPLDALHLACAIMASADYFCTCDDRLLKRARAVRSEPPKIVSPLELVAELGI